MKMRWNYSWIWVALLGVACSSNTTTPTEEIKAVEDQVVDCSLPTAQASEAPMRLLTRYEFDFTVRDLFGVDADYARANFPVENASEGFESTSEHTLSDNMLRKVLEVAETLSPAAAVNWDQNTVTLEVMLKRAFRRPPTEEETARFKDMWAKALLEWGPDRAQEMVIEAILLSPQFLYRIELEDSRPNAERILNDPYETASRLSYFLWGSMPDDQLFEAADRGELETKAQVEAQVVRMLRDPKAQDLVHEFYRQYLGLNALKTVVRDQGFYPEYDSGLVDDYLHSARRFFEEAHFGEEGGDVQTLLTSDKVYLTPDLAALLGEADTDVVAKPNERAGLLTHPALLMLLAYPDQTSPIHRGIFVRERILCQPLPPPPNNIVIEPPEFDPSLSTRQRFEQLTEADLCTSCHVRIDPIGFGFENYDALGRYRVHDAGKPVDGSGSITFTKDPNIAGTFDGAVELATRLSQADEVKACIAEQWFRFAQGKRPEEGDYCEVRERVDTFASSEGRFADLMISITTSDTFRHRVLQGEGP